MLNRRQKAQVDRQLESHTHRRYEVDIKLGWGGTLKNFVVHPDVMRPELMTSLHLARWLFSHKDLFYKRNALDMGCGSGIQGVVMGLYGAKYVAFSDISQQAVRNARENARKYNLSGKSVVVKSDLFENMTGKFDIMVFNHPFFPANPMKGSVVSSAMLDNGNLICRFLEDAKNYLNAPGVIIMPFFHLAGPLNDPGIQAPKHGYKIVDEARKKISIGLQKGVISIYEITK